MARSEIEKFVEDQKRMRLYQQEYLIMQVTERICDLMEQNGVSRSELATKLGTSKGYITQLLDGRANMTLRTLADVCAVLGVAIDVQTRQLQATVRPTMSMVETASWQRPTKRITYISDDLDLHDCREVKVA